MTPLPLSPEELDQLARKRAGAKLGWYIHAVVYILVNLGLFAISHYAFGDRRWSVFPLLGWGLGLVLHGVAVFVLGGGSGLRERMVQKEREKLLRERGNPQAPP
jgi:protein-S-isoprenylcysteine O-methyltransferase Ste14